jgi:hypothetical protein
MKKHSVRRIALGVLIGIVVVIALGWLLTLTLGNKEQYLFAGNPIKYWHDQLNGPGPRASNEAFAVVNTQVIPQLTNSMFHDNHDSGLRLSLIEGLNALPGVQIYFTEAGGRRAHAARSIGELGPPARSAVPALVQALKGKDTFVHEAAIWSLGKIHSDPDILIPLLITYLDDDSLNDEATLALANYGILAKAAVPKIIPLLQAPDKDTRAAAVEALQKIDPEAYTNATKAYQRTFTNTPSRSVGAQESPRSK